MNTGTLETQERKPTATALERSGTRLHYIDWLRVLAVLLLFPFHTLRVFNADDPWYVKADTLSMPVTYLLGFISVWHMQLLFLLAGASTCFALRRRTSRQYVGERLLRLGIPFLFGVFVLIPPQTYDGARFNSGYTESFWHYITSGDFLQWNVKDGGDYYGGFGIGHLWFILVLLLVSLVVLPLLAWGGAGEAARSCKASRAASPAPPGGWWPRSWCGSSRRCPTPPVSGSSLPHFFVLGYVAVRGPEFMASAERFRLRLWRSACRWPRLVSQWRVPRRGRPRVATVRADLPGELASG